MYITRKVITPDQIALMRAAVERAQVPDAWMSTLILLLDPFQRETDRNGARPCFQRATDQTDEQEPAADETDEQTTYNPESYLDPVYDRYSGFRA